ncbi:MAG TPA: CAP domain-containing protein [Gaiellaceae bacterium]|nr:CAP domain-containing protein [Gaiellaceae bacterium]
MTSATAAARPRLAVTAAVLVSLMALLAVRVAQADGATRAWSAYLAPTGACAASDDKAAPSAVQARAITCLLNWARVQDRRGRLTQRPALRRAAALKGERVASCVQLSHTPCGTSVTAAVQAAGYRYSTFGENLFAGTWGQVSARDVVRAWLQSPPHRANLLHPGFRDVGAAPARAPGLLGDGDAVVWAATFAAPR